MAFKDLIYTTLATKTGVQPKDSQLAAHTILQMMKAKMPAATAMAFQKMLDSEDGVVAWPVPGATAHAPAPTPAPVVKPVAVKKPTTFGAKVTPAPVEAPAPAASAPVVAKPTLVPTQLAGPKTLGQKIRSIFLTN